MMGYLNNEEATKKTIDADGYLHSGDQGRLEEGGFLRITGRIKELIITAGGENVAPVPIEDNFKAQCEACSNIMVVGEQKRFIAALISFKVDMDPKTMLPSHNLMAEAVKFFKNEVGVDVKTTDEAIINPKVIDFVHRAIEKTNAKSVSRPAHIRKFTLIPDDFSINGTELTPTMKLKRKVTEAKYKHVIDEMFVQTAKL